MYVIMGHETENSLQSGVLCMAVIGQIKAKSVGHLCICGFVSCVSEASSFFFHLFWKMSFSQLTF